MICWKNTKLNFRISIPTVESKIHYLAQRLIFNKDFRLNTNESWAVALPALENVLSRSNLNSEQKEEFLSYFKPIFESFQFNHPISLSVPGQDVANHFNYEIELFMTALESHTSELLVERFQRELEIYISELWK